MINIQLKRKVLAAAAAVMLLSGFSVASSAATIDVDSEIAFFGAYSADIADLNQATELLFPQPVFVATGTNDFASLESTNVDFNTISFDPFAPVTVLTFAGGGFTATSLTIDLQTSTSLDITMTGVWSLEGFDDTIGVLILSADTLGNSGLFTFTASGTVTAVPVPAAVWLFGSALAGLGLTRRRT